MALTETQLQSMSFGYITGGDLVDYSSPQLLIKQYLVNNTSLQRGVNTAYGEAIAALSRKYNMQTEFAKVGFVPAILVAVVTAGVVTSVVIVASGAAYSAVPVISFGGPGTAAAATVTLTEGKITAVAVTNGGTGYTTAPAITLAGGVPTDTRSTVLVKIVSILAVENIMGNMQGLSDVMLLNFKWVAKALLDIRNGQSNLPLNSPALPDPEDPLTSIQSKAVLINNSFSTLG